MFRVRQDPRPNWQKKVEELGFHFHTLRGEPYWDETVSYQFTPREVDMIEAATNDLHEMCLDLVQEVIDDKLFSLFLIPPEFHDMIIRSWELEQPSLYGRFDFTFDGIHPPKLLEYNADTPTALLEASVVQWHWLKELDERGDQFNSIHEHLLEAWKPLADKHFRMIHFAAMGDVIEDYVTVEYLRDTAIQAGLATEYLDVEAIGFNHFSKRFVDTREQNIDCLFKLYPWEWVMREGFGQYVREAQIQWLEPPWKMILSNKAILPLLYERYPECPYLVPASFQPLPGHHIRKPLLSREGANIAYFRGSDLVNETSGGYGDGPFIYQEYIPIKPHDGFYPILGSWVVNGESCGMGIREDSTFITQNTSRFVPHSMS